MTETPAKKTPLNIRQIDWSNVERVLVVKLRSIGDTVLSTPCLIALRRFLPDAQIDILLEDWVAPLLEGHDAVDNVISVGKNASERVRTGLVLRRQGYDLAFNLHGGTTATFLTAASRAKRRVGFTNYRFPFLYTDLLSSAADFWHAEKVHSAEQQLALLGYVGIPVDDRPRSRLRVLEEPFRKIDARLTNVDRPVALIHPSSAFATKQWPTENFAMVAELLAELGLQPVAVASRKERRVLDQLVRKTPVSILVFDDLSLPEITALAHRSKIFIGNDSGIAHIAAAVSTPTVVIFGSSNRNHWRPWTDAPNEIVFKEFRCQPCPGYECAEFGEPRCIREVTFEAVKSSIVRLISGVSAPRISL